MTITIATTTNMQQGTPFSKYSNFGEVENAAEKVIGLKPEIND